MSADHMTITRPSHDGSGLAWYGSRGGGDLDIHSCLYNVSRFILHDHVVNSTVILS